MYMHLFRAATLRMVSSVGIELGPADCLLCRGRSAFMCLSTLILQKSRTLRPLSFGAASMGYAASQSRAHHMTALSLYTHQG